MKVNVLVGYIDSAGLSVPYFSLITKSEAKFLCVYCLLIEQAAQITNLHNTVNKLLNPITHLQGTETVPATNAAQGDKGSLATWVLYPIALSLYQHLSPQKNENLI